MNDQASGKVIRITRKPRPESASLRSLSLGDGSIATVEDGALELRDPRGRLLVRYADGNAEIAAPDGDLILAAPSGGVVIRSALDVELVADRDVIHRAARNINVTASGSVTTAARAVATTASSLAITVEKYELNATRLYEKSRDAFRDVVDLAQTRVGRARTVVTDLFTLKSRRTVIASKEDTSIDGRKILLG